VAGLLTMAVGALLFVPAGVCCLLSLVPDRATRSCSVGLPWAAVSANPYVDLLGKPETAFEPPGSDAKPSTRWARTVAPKIGGSADPECRATGGSNN